MAITFGTLGTQPTYQSPEVKGLWKGIYRFSNWLTNWHNRAGDFFDRQVGDLEKNKASRVEIGLVKGLKGLVKQFTNYDFVNFTPGRMSFTTPPPGALIVMAYLGLIYPRAYRAWERSFLPNGERDKREIGDVIRRDGWAITVYIFGLGIISRWMAKGFQKALGVELIKPGESEPISFSAHDANSHLYNEKVFQRQIEHGNLRGLHKAMNNEAYFGIPQKIQKNYPEFAKKLAKHIEDARSAVKELHGATLNDGTKTLLTDVSAKVETALKELTDLREGFFRDHALEPKLLSSLQRQWPEYRSFFARYAKNLRAPLDLISFVIVLFLLGFAPVWANRHINEKQYKKKLRALVAEQARSQRPLTPEQAFQQFKQSASVFSATKAAPQQAGSASSLTQAAFSGGWNRSA